jgi:hypothetical protein
MADSNEIFAEDENVLLSRATLEIAKRGNERITIETDLQRIIAVISIVQLGLRHPGVHDKPTAAVAERFVISLIENIDPAHGPVWQLLNRGFNPVHDV